MLNCFHPLPETDEMDAIQHRGKRPGNGREFREPADYRTRRAPQQEHSYLSPQTGVWSGLRVVAKRGAVVFEF